MGLKKLQFALSVDASRTVIYAVGKKNICIVELRLSHKSQLHNVGKKIGNGIKMIPKLMLR